ncbi:hypothetical protein RN001_005968 [Aquatica leii]|uniref:Uncharacterized protein n=1 Tax=Aquatica leii TaxID=1421715 RepID=A0AAN7Q139_9COLE|nr:hypothetical protein RN001_005968 [Aquatica leii]
MNKAYICSTCKKVFFDLKNHRCTSPSDTPSTSAASADININNEDEVAPKSSLTVFLIPSNAIVVDESVLLNHCSADDVTQNFGYYPTLKLQTVVAVIMATGVLHNIPRSMHEDEPPIPEEVQIQINNGQIPAIPAVHINNDVINVRNDLINNYFAML